MREVRIVDAMLEHRSPSVLMTDGYKFSMAQAGFPLRRETFHLVFRYGGPWFVPFDLKEIVNLLLPKAPPNAAEGRFLDQFGYRMTPAMTAAVVDADVDIWAAPKGSWFCAKEPVLTVTGPSFLKSWLEPLSLMLHFSIQVATALKAGQKKFVCTCLDEAEIVRATMEEIGIDPFNVYVTIESDDYRASVARRVSALVAALEDKNPARIFEVGMRAVTCLAMHRIALEECQKAGVTRTSNVHLAYEMGMTPVGTTGHEHIQRWGDDLSACRAIRDMRPTPPSYLPDTFDALGRGLPAAVQAMQEVSGRRSFVRFDSGDQWPQLVAAETVSRRFLKTIPDYIFEDGINDVKVARDEEWCRKLDIVPDRRLYGSGNFLVKSEQTNLGRDAVAAVWKLSKTGDTPVMKTCVTAPTKASLPGVPVTFRRIPGVPCDPKFKEFSGLAGQAGETPPAGFGPLVPSDAAPIQTGTGLSPATEKLVEECKARLGEPAWSVAVTDIFKVIAGDFAETPEKED